MSLELEKEDFGRVLPRVADQADAQQSPEGVWKPVLRRLWKDKAAIVGAVIILVIIGLAIFAPLVSPYDPNKVDLMQRLKPPGTEGHLLGTDQLGRDLLSRMIWGGRVSVAVGVAAVAIAMFFGVLLGLVAGYFSGTLDLIIMRIIDVLMAFPYVLLAIAIIAAFGPGLVNSMIAISIIGIPYYARIVRGSILSLREKEFVQAEEALGASHLRIMFRHLLPNVFSSVIVAATLDVGWMIMAAAGMSFLGLGAQPPMAEWGVMLSDGRKFIRVAPYLSLLPGLAIFLVVLAFNLLGDGMRDALDPHLKE